MTTELNAVSPATQQPGPSPAGAPEGGPHGYKFPPVHPEGIKFVVASVGLTALAFWLWSPLGWVFVGLTLWVVSFFRDPERVSPRDPLAVIAPADGLVTRVMTVAVPRQLAGEGGLADSHLVRVSIFMSVFDVHVNRAPIAGAVSRITYVPGTFVNADLDKASEDNERQYFVVEGAGGARVGFTQIAGLIARRIVKFVRVGDVLAAGQRVGLIRFGSRVDVYLPVGAVVTVLPGQRTVAGETVLGRLTATAW